MYQAALERDPEYSWAWAHMGLLFHEGLRDTEAALAAYRCAVSLDPDYSWAWSQIARLLFEEGGDLDEAEMASLRAVELEPDSAWAWSIVGVVQRVRGNARRALDALDRAVALDPEYAWAWAQRGSLLADEFSRFGKAKSSFMRAIGIEPRFAWAWVELGRLHQKKGKYAEAKRAFTHALDLDRTDYTAWESLIRLGLSVDRDSKEAIHTARNYIEAMEKAPDSIRRVVDTFTSAKCREAYPQLEDWLMEGLGREPGQPDLVLCLDSLKKARRKTGE
jgi:tetratricopeptide (TPR) repeat protein